MKMLRHKDVMDLLAVSNPTATKYLNAFEEEYLKGDSKLPQTSLIYLDNNTRLIEEEAFLFFMANRNMLADSRARKTVPKFLREVI